MTCALSLWGFSFESAFGCTAKNENENERKKNEFFFSSFFLFHDWIYFSFDLDFVVQLKSWVEWSACVLFCLLL